MATVKFGTAEFGDGLKYNLYNFAPNEDVTINRKTTQYYMTDGETLLSTLYGARVVTLTGHIIADSYEDMHKDRRALCACCDGKTEYTLIYDTGFEIYTAPAVADIPKFSRPEGTSIEFTINFNMFGFFWLSEDMTFTSQIRCPLIKDSFTLPAVFSTLSEDDRLNNYGDAPCPFIAEIFVLTAGNTEITLENSATGKKITVTHDFTAGDILTIDTGKCTVTSAIDGNLINYVSADSEFFTMCKGNNVMAASGQNDVCMRIKYNIRYTGV